MHVAEQPAVDEAGQSALQAALLCQILQHSQLQAQQHQQEQRLQRARHAAGQAMLPGSSEQSPACPGSLQEDLDQRVGAWRAPAKDVGSGSPGPCRTPGHTSGDPRQHLSVGLGSAASGSLLSTRPSTDHVAADAPQHSSAAAFPRPKRAGRTQSSLAGWMPARHAEMLPAHITVTRHFPDVRGMADACCAACADASKLCTFPVTDAQGGTQIVQVMMPSAPPVPTDQAYSFGRSHHS